MRIKFHYKQNIKKKGNGAVTVSWFYRGSQIQSNSSLSLNTGDSLTLKCNAISNFNVDGGMAAMFMLMFAASSTANPALAVSYTTGCSPNAMQAAITRAIRRNKQQQDELFMRYSLLILAASSKLFI